VGRAALLHAAVVVGAGIALGLTRPVPEWGGPFLVAVGLAGAGAAGVLLARDRGRWGDRAVAALLASAGLVLGLAGRAGFDRSCVNRLPDGQRLEAVGTVVSGRGPQLRVRVDSLYLAAGPVPCRSEIPARARGHDCADRTGTEPAAAARAAAALSTGDAGELVGARIRAEVRWWTPPGATPSLLRRPGTLMLEEVVAREPARARAPPAERVRRGARERVDSLFGEQSPLAASILLAQRDALDREVRDRFARAGLSHLLAISGLHVGLICGILLLVGSLLRLGRRWGAVFAAAGTVGYVLLLGAPYSAVRAALQIVLLLVARMLQRPTRAEALVAAAALFILAIDPAALVRPGFQLSFAGVAGLLALRPPLLRALGGRNGEGGGGPVARARRWLADALATSLAATLATGPVVAWHFGQVAPIGVATNLVAIPLLSLALPALALALAVGWVWPAAGAFLAAPGALALAALDQVAAGAAAVPGGAVAVHGSTALLLTAALVAGHAVSGRMGRLRPAVRAAAVAGMAASVALAAGAAPPSDRLEIHVIDVGQGDAVAVRTPAGRWLLVDAGMAGRGFDVGERRVVPYLARRGVRRLEGVVLTHPHLDHMGGAGAVVRALRPRWVGDPGSPVASAPYLALLRLVEGSGPGWVGLRQGHRLVLDGVTVEFLHPPEVGAREDDPNDLSVVMMVWFGEFAALLTGDATARVEARLLRRYGSELRADVLKLGHHGSATSTTPEFLAATSPAVAVVSVGASNRYGHPHRAVMDRLASREVRVLRTDRHGSIVVRADAHGDIRVETEREAGS
jgi:competence protein ComEC